MCGEGGGGAWAGIIKELKVVDDEAGARRREGRGALDLTQLQD
jgi:hypothetical protein